MAMSASPSLSMHRRVQVPPLSSLLASSSQPIAAPPNYLKFCSYSEHRKHVKDEACQKHYRKHVIIFGLTWIIPASTDHFVVNGNNDDNDDDSGGGSLLLASCSSLGELIIWRVSRSSSNANDDKGTTTTRSPVGMNRCSTRPVYRRVVSKGKLYSIKLIESAITAATTVQGAGKRLLMVSGDEGVLVFDWDQDICLEPQQQQKTTTFPVLTSTARFQPYPSPLESRGIEVNDFEILNNNNNNCLFGAAGDSFGVYKWNLETGQLMTNYKSTGSGYLHSLALLPQQNTLLAGGEGGRIEFWDVHNDKSIHQIDLTTASAADASNTTTTTTSSTTGIMASRSNSGKRSKNLPSRWISSICALHQNWFAVGGGSTTTTGNVRGAGSSTAGRNGFVATYHQPTRSLVAFCETRETPQQLSSFPPSSDLQHTTIVSVANEGVVSHWNGLSLEQHTRRMWTTSPSGYAVSISPDGAYTALAGVGCFVDIFDANGERSLRLEVC